MATALCLATLIYNFNKTQAASDHAEAIIRDKLYEFDWDYIINTNDNGDVSVQKNSDSQQDKIATTEESIIGARVFTCCGDIESLSVLLGDKVQVSSNGDIKITNRHELEQISDCDNLSEGCLQSWQLPVVKAGTYNLVYSTGGEEVDEVYITPIKIGTAEMDDSISIDVGPKKYSFDVDYIVRHGDTFPGTEVSVNKDATQKTAQAKAGQRIEAFINDSPENGHVDSANMFLTKDKIKVSDHSIKLVKK